MGLFDKLLKVFNAEPNIITAPKSKEDINTLIDEIHETFYTEVDKLLEGAKVLRSEETTKQDLIDKVTKLKSLGFSNTKECKEAEIELKRLSEIKQENRSKERLASAIMYFSAKYPNYKFITKDSVKKICEKYNLVYGSVNKYIGTVPDKNLKEMQNFKIDDEDKSYLKTVDYGDMYSSPNITYISYNDFQKYLESKDTRKVDRLGNTYIDYRSYSRSNTYYSEENLFIAAPIKDFNMEGYEVKDHKISKIEIPDPVVLQPVHYQGNRYFLIVTAWGQEAQDELVFNEKQN